MELELSREKFRVKESFCFVFLFKKRKKAIYLATPGPKCSTWDLKLQRTG